MKGVIRGDASLIVTRIFVGRGGASSISRYAREREIGIRTGMIAVVEAFGCWLVLAAIFSATHCLSEDGFVARLRHDMFRRHRIVWQGRCRPTIDDPLQDGVSESSVVVRKYAK